MFSKTPTFKSDLVPGYINVPALTFNVETLCDYVKVNDNISKARDFSAKYIKNFKMFEKS